MSDCILNEIIILLLPECRQWRFRCERSR